MQVFLQLEASACPEGQEQLSLLSQDKAGVAVDDLRELCAAYRTLSLPPESPGESVGIMPISAPPRDVRRLRGQNEAIYKRLQQGPARLSELANIARKYTSRISDIRAWLLHYRPTERIVCRPQPDHDNLYLLSGEHDVQGLRTI